MGQNAESSGKAIIDPLCNMRKLEEVPGKQGEIASKRQRRLILESYIW